MSMVVSGRGGVTVSFPDGTDPTTIDTVMRQATGAAPVGSLAARQSGLGSNPAMAFSPTEKNGKGDRSARR